MHQKGGGKVNRMSLQREPKRTPVAMHSAPNVSTTNSTLTNTVSSVGRARHLTNKTNENESKHVSRSWFLSLGVHVQNAAVYRQISSKRMFSADSLAQWAGFWGVNGGVSSHLFPCAHRRVTRDRYNRLLDNIRLLSKPLRRRAIKPEWIMANRAKGCGPKI